MPLWIWAISPVSQVGKLRHRAMNGLDQGPLAGQGQSWDLLTTTAPTDNLFFITSTLSRIIILSLPWFTSIPLPIQRMKLSWLLEDFCLFFLDRALFCLDKESRNGISPHSKISNLCRRKLSQKRNRKRDECSLQPQNKSVKSGSLNMQSYWQVEQFLAFSSTCLSCICPKEDVCKPFVNDDGDVCLKKKKAFSISSCAFLHTMWKSCVFFISQILRPHMSTFTHGNSSLNKCFNLKH